jgi:hypothetical protein
MFGDPIQFIPWDTKWKVVPGFHTYFVSNHGQVFDMSRLIIVEQFLDPDFTIVVNLKNKNNGWYTESVDRLRQQAFGETDEDDNLPIDKTGRRYDEDVLHVWDVRTARAAS